MIIQYYNTISYPSIIFLHQILYTITTNYTIKKNLGNSIDESKEPKSFISKCETFFSILSHILIIDERNWDY